MVVATGEMERYYSRRKKKQNEVINELTSDKSSSQ